MAYCVYFLTNHTNSVLYVGVTSNIARRIAEHKSGEQAGFTSQYRCYKLIYLEEFKQISDALTREKQIKGWSRAKKEMLVNAINPNWKELFLLGDGPE